MKQAVSSPLLETTIEGASHVIINISGDISLIEANEAAGYVQELAGDDANIIFGAMYDENAEDEVTITVIATGLDAHGANTPVERAMKDFTNYKTKVPAPSAAGISHPENCSAVKVRLRQQLQQSLPEVQYSDRKHTGLPSGS